MNGICLFRFTRPVPQSGISADSGYAENIEMDLLKDQVETVLVMSGFTVTNRMHNGINILEMRDSETRDIFYIAFVDNHW